MKCSDCLKQLSNYVEQDVSPLIKTEIELHVKQCPECQAVLQFLQEEVEVMKESIQIIPLPAPQFAESIMSQLGAVPQQEQQTKSPLRRSQRPTRWKKAAVASVVAVFAAVSIGTYVSPTFASYVSSFINRIGGETGVKKAAEQGFSTEVNAVYKDQGITLRIKEIVADPTRIVVSYILEDEQGKMMDDLFIPFYGENRLYLTDADGNEVQSLKQFRRGEDYADFIFSLNHPPKQLTAHFDIKVIGSKPETMKKGNWKLAVPVNLEKGYAATRIVPISESYTSPQGLQFQLKEFMFAPSAARLRIETNWTDEAKKQQGEQPYEVSTFNFRLLNKQGEVVADSRQRNYTENKTGVLDWHSMFRSVDQEKQLWTAGFLPSVEQENLTFVLDSLDLIEPADFHMTFKPEEIKKQPLTATYKDKSYTVKSVEKKLDPESNQELIHVRIDSEMSNDMESPSWVVKDQNGKEYETSIDYETLDAFGDAKVHHYNHTVIIKGMTDLPKELTFSLKEEIKQYTNLNWTVPLPIKAPAQQ